MFFFIPHNAYSLKPFSHLLILFWTLRSILGYPERCHNHCFNFNCFRLHYSFCCLPFNFFWGNLLFTRQTLGRLLFEINWGNLPFFKKLRSSSIFLLVAYRESASWVAWNWWWWRCFLFFLPIIKSPWVELGWPRLWQW